MPGSQGPPQMAQGVFGIVARSFRQSVP